jgi:DNA-directed RNA polymerase specialized sigma24 family protein
LLGLEDAEQELWLAVFRNIKTRYTKGQPLAAFVRRVVFSNYGRWLQVRTNKTKLLNEGLISLNKRSYKRSIPEETLEENVGYISADYSKVEDNYILDCIRADLSKRVNQSKRYQKAVRILDALRNGFSMKECCKRMHIHVNYGNKIFGEIIKECGQKYA